MSELPTNSGIYPLFPEKDLTKEDIKEMNRIFDEDQMEELTFIRQLAEAKYDFRGYDHVNCYNLDNYRNGVLYALEQTRRRISVESVEKIIEYYFILGYSQKRIVYQAFEAGYNDINTTLVNRHIKRHKQRLLKERENLMGELDQVANGVFQAMRAQVMAQENKTLRTLLEKQEILNKRLEELDPIADKKEFTSTMDTIDRIQNRINSMNGIDGLRKASLEIAKQEGIEKAKRILANGWMDDELKEIQDKKKAALSGGSEESGIRNVEGKTKTIDL